MKLNEPADLKTTIEKRNGRLIVKLPGRSKVMTTKTFSQIEDVLSLYELPDELPVSHRNDIAAYLGEHKDLIPVLAEAKRQVLRIFGKVPVRLELIRDPEEGWQKLYGIIKVPLPVEKALALEERFDNEWFIDIFAKTDGLNMGVEVING